MPEQSPLPPKASRARWLRDPTVVVALLGLIGTIIAGLLASPLLPVLIARPTPAAPTAVVASPVSALTAPAVEITGPDTAPLGQKTYFTILSRNALRAEWSVGGFGQNQALVVDPLGPSHQIFVEPTDATRVGERFVIAVTVYAADGQTATAAWPFVVTTR